MKTKEILNIEINLLLLKYGKSACLKALAENMDKSPQILELDLLRFQRTPTTFKSARKPSNTAFNIDDLIAQHSEKRDHLKELHSRFINKTFLPELKDVRRFFDRYKGSAPALKSRDLASKKLFELLSDLEIVELEKIKDYKSNQGSHSSLGLISDEILGRNRERNTPNKKGN